jgi:Trk K+ transport system NAD-binding subunit
MIYNESDSKNYHFFYFEEGLNIYMKFKQKMKYKFECFLSKGTFSLIMMLFLITFISVTIVGIVAFFVSGEDSVFHVVWVSFMQTLDAGNLSGEEGQFFYVFLMTISTIVGIFVTSLLISFISSGFQSKLENLQKGTSRIIEKNHTLILGYNENVKVIVGELIEANLNVKHPVVAILSEQGMMETLNDLKQNLRSFRNTKIIIRTGSFYDKTKLEMCSIADAKSVIIAEEDDSNTIKAILAIRQTPFFDEGHNGYISTIISHEMNLTVAQNIGGVKLEVIHLSDAMNRIMSQTCLQPGLSFIYKDIFDFNGDEFYFFNHYGELTNRTFGSIFNDFNKSSVVGLFSNSQVLLNPPHDTLIEQEDQIIVISEDDDTIYLGRVENHDYDTLIEKTIHSESRVKRSILSIGFNDSTLDVIKGFEPYIKKGSKITFLVSNELSTHFYETMATYDAVEYEVKQGITYDRETLENIDFSKINTVIVFGNNIDDDKSDSETLLTVLHLREIEKKLNIDLQIVIEIKKNSNADCMQYASIDDFVVSNILSNKMLSQISENRHLNKVFQELLSSDGSEIYLKPAKNYIKLNVALSYETVVRSASFKNEIAIGYKLKSHKEHGGVFVNPEKDLVLSFHEGDYVIVLAED